VWGSWVAPGGLGVGGVVTDEGGFVHWLRGDAQSPLNCIASTISRSTMKIAKLIQTFYWLSCGFLRTRTRLNLRITETRFGIFPSPGLISINKAAVTRIRRVVNFEIDFQIVA